jgi:hypothetical protein
MIKKALVRLLVCRHGRWNTPEHPARHDFETLPGTEVEKFVCRRCEYTLGF